MFSKINHANLLYLIPLNFILLIQFNFTFHDSNTVNHYLLFDYFYATLLLIVGIVVYYFSEHRNHSNIFLAMMISTGWIIILLHHPTNYLLIGIARILMCLNNILLYVFFSHFFNLHSCQLYFNLLGVITSSSILTLIALISFIPILAYSLFVLLFVTVTCCIILSTKNRFIQPILSRKYQLFLIASIALAILPFIFLRFFNVPPEFVRFSFYSFISLPIGIAVAYARRNKLKVDFDTSSILISLFVFIFIHFIYLLFCLYILNLTSVQILNSFLFLYFMVYFYESFKAYSRKKKIIYLNTVKQSFEKERLEILQKITYDNYLESLSLVLNELIENALPLSGHLVIWKEEEGHSFILTQSGVFSNSSLSGELIRQLQNHFSVISWKDNQYFSIPMFYKNILCGWLIVGSKSNGDNFSKQDIEKLTLLSRTVGELLKTTETLYNNKEEYAALPDTTNETLFNLQLQLKSDELRKSLSLYLHDDILQNIIALKNLTETLKTPQTELKKIIIETLSQLNSSLREKMFDIFPSSLLDLRFYDSLILLIQKVEQGPLVYNSPSIQLLMDPNLEIPQNLRFPIFRTIKELLQNSLKHGHAQRIIISVSIDDKILLIKVEDDGVGMKLQTLLNEKKGKGAGLLSIKHEISTLNGQFFINDQMEKGVAFKIKVPLTNNKEEIK